MLRIVHTSDWHLGHTLHGLSREQEHARFLQWLLELLARERPDALLITGDVFETANPPARAERAWFDFLALARQARPGLSVLVIAGNHDAPARLEAPAPLIERLGVRVIGSARGPDGRLDPERLLIPLSPADQPPGEPGEPAAWVAAVPFLRPSDLPPTGPVRGADDAGEEQGVRAVYEAVLALARARRRPGQALLATGHLPLGGALRSEGSERALPIGRVRELPLDLFPPDLDYVALGHLHRPQAVGGRQAVRYAGSPIPLSLTERDYPHQVVVVDLLLGGAVVRPVLIPRSVDLLRLPEGEPGEPAEVLELLRALPARGAREEELLPLLEVRVRLAAPDPGLRARVEEALRGRAARLIKLTLERSEPAPGAPAPAAPGGLRELTPLEVLRRCWGREREGTPPPGLEAAFLQLLGEVEAEQAREETLPAAPAPPLALPDRTVAGVAAPGPAEAVSP